MPFALELHFTDSVRLVRVQLGFAYSPTSKPNEREALHLAPATPTVELLEAAEITNRGTNRDRLDVGDLTQYFSRSGML